MLCACTNFTQGIFKIFFLRQNLTMWFGWLWTHCVSQTALEHSAVLLFLTPDCWHYRHATPHPDQQFSFYFTNLSSNILEVWITLLPISSFTTAWNLMLCRSPISTLLILMPLHQHTLQPHFSPLVKSTLPSQDPLLRIWEVTSAHSLCLCLYLVASLLYFHMFLLN